MASIESNDIKHLYRGWVAKMAEKPGKTGKIPYLRNAASSESE